MLDPTCPKLNEGAAVVVVLCPNGAAFVLVTGAPWPKLNGAVLTFVDAVCLKLKEVVLTLVGGVCPKEIESPLAVVA